ncbi:neutral/alkaline non-lysosomal ceramidase N-terminal domain-containing protein [Paenibacillus koleovorans]|uniref:neutral/alkaline non-lysosomal ceramidase N-terminal domain-containing protein n=1 Tax=Paenibacillus koleovorans TaxID=121608 RepID=UPI000FD75685|nr:neutral/alkaline non-lysosomal ceramidase N-terminal domain-containing protein [Paenibacillus koleovorans]
MLQCGMYETVITPPIGSSIPGYLTERKNTHTIDDLYAKALVLATDSSTLALVVLDALYVRKSESDRIRERVEQFTGIPRQHIMVSATHTHTGGPIRPGFDQSLNASYLDYMVERAADAVIQAYNERRPATMGLGIGYEHEISFNRRYYMADGTVRTNPGFQHPQLDRPTGPIDPEVLVVRLDDENGKPIGVVTNFACHTDTVGGTGICADFPGELSRSLKGALGERVVSLFVLGACGNINHLDFTKPAFSIQPEHYRKMGRILAAEVLRTREKIEMIAQQQQQQSTLPIAALHSEFELVYRMPDAAAVADAERTLQSANASVADRFFAEELLYVKNNPIDSVPIEIQVFRLADLVIAGLPGEIFVEFGLSIKQSSPFAYTMINTLCNSSTTGYVCTRDAFVQGGYEPKLRNVHRNPPQAGEWFVEHAVRLIRGLDA